MGISWFVESRLTPLRTNYVFKGHDWASNVRELQLESKLAGRDECSPPSMGTPVFARATLGGLGNERFEPVAAF